MVFLEEWGKIFWEALIYLAYILVCGCLVIRRFSRGRCLAIVGGMLAAVLLGQVWLFLSSGDIMTVLTLLPVTLYLPSILCIHIISKMRFFQTMAVWTAGLLVYNILKIFLKFFMRFFGDFGAWKMKYGMVYIFWVSASLFFVAALLVFFVWRFLSKPFHQYVSKEGAEGWFLCFPTLAVILLFSYLGYNVENQLVLALLLLVVAAVFFALLKALTAFVALEHMKEAEREVAAYMQAQRREYEDMCAKMEAGRAYRHDMRHHLVVLENLAKENEDGQVVEYIGKLRGQLSATEWKAYCENLAVNAVLSAYIQEAQECCVVEARISIPKELRYDEMDICAVLANALENAKNECAKIAESGKRYIKITAKLVKEWKFVFCVENSCDGPVPFGPDGLPEGKTHDGHGIGLKSIDAIVKKYSGILRCECENGVFRLDAALFWPKQDEQARQEIGFRKERPCINRRVSVAAMALLLLLFFCGIPLLGSGLAQKTEEVAQQDERGKSSIQWGDTVFSVELPVPMADTAYEGSVEEYLYDMKDIFISYVQNKYMGYVAVDVTNEVLRDDAHFLSVRFNTTINAGGSGDCSRCFTLDKQKGGIVGLSDLFSGDYIRVISEEILRQMEEQMAAGEGDYFLPGGIWSEEECFHQIDADQNFYLNEKDEVVVVFDEYVVAPGNMGMPEFTIPKDVLAIE